PVIPKNAEGLTVNLKFKREELSKAAKEVSVVSFGSSSMMNTQHKPRWRGPGDTMRFEMTLRVQGDAKNMALTPAVYTNANHNADPHTWRAHKMSFVSQKGNKATFALDLPIYRLGNYQATGVVLDGDKPALWARSSGIRDISFRPY